MAGWKASAQYGGGLSADSAAVTWFWAVVEAMSAEHRAQLLQFCTGSSLAPATGFASLQGFNGAQHRFKLQGTGGGPDRLPTAHTCFNTLDLPAYTSMQQLRSRLLTAISCATGFDEGAAA